MTAAIEAVPPPAPPILPGRDHRSLLLFLQWVEASRSGNVMLEHERMRDKRRTHSGFGVALDPLEWREKYGTRYDDGRVNGQHDDFDCMHDLAEWGYVELGGTGAQPLVKLTDAGHELARGLIRSRNEREASRSAFDVRAVIDTGHSVLEAATPSAHTVLAQAGATGLRLHTSTPVALAWVDRLRRSGMIVKVEDERATAPPLPAQAGAKRPRRQAPAGS
jgi:hypothetical protein